MNYNKLELNKKYKNYKVVCEVLGVKPKTGKSKQIHLTDLERFTNFNKEGNGFVFTEIKENPDSKVDGRKVNSEYIFNIERLLLDFLGKKEYQVPNDSFGHSLIGCSKLVSVLSILNSKYDEYLNSQRDLAELLNVPVSCVYDWYNKAPNKLLRDVEKALDELQNKSLITWSKTIVFNITVDAGSIGSDGEILEKSFTYNRPATNKEKAALLEVQHETLEAFNSETLNEVIVSGQYKEYVSEVSNILSLQDDINGLNFYYNGFDIVFLEMFYTFDSELRNSVIKDVRKGAYSELSKLDKRRHNTAYDMISRNDERTKVIHGYRACSEYMPNMSKITKSLMSIDELLGKS